MEQRLDWEPDRQSVSGREEFPYFLYDAAGNARTTPRPSSSR